MISTITNYSNNIDTLFPVPGQDNDSQGFRDNFANIRQSLGIAADEINKLSLDRTQIIQKTVIVQGTNGGLQGTNIGLSSATIRLHQNEVDPTRSSPALSITGTCHVSVSCDKTGSVVHLTGTHGGSSWPYDNYFTVDRPDLVKLGSTFKFYNAEKLTYTVTDVNSTTVYVNSSFDPVELRSYGVTTGTAITVYDGKMLSSIFRDHTPPTTLFGKPRDAAGALVVTSSSEYIAHTNYTNGVNKIWSQLSTNVESNRLVIVNPSTAYSSGVPNVTCDLSAGTRFYINNPNDDIGINFINLPATPCQVEVCVTIQSTTSRLLRVHVDGAAATSPLINTITQSAPGWGRRYAITLLVTAPGMVTAVMDVTHISSAI
jgi:hypothetical protein